MKTYYHFSNTEGTLGNNDGRKIALRETLSVEGEIRACVNGLHGSPTVRQALLYASGPRLWKTKIWGDMDEQNDKAAGRHRKPVRDYGNVLPLIIEFAQACAERAQEHASKSTSRAATANAAYAAADAADAADYADYASRVAARAADYAANAAYAAANAADAAAYATSADTERKWQDTWWDKKLAALEK